MRGTGDARVYSGTLTHRKVVRSVQCEADQRHANRGSPMKRAALSIIRDEHQALAAMLRYLFQRIVMTAPAPIGLG